MESDTDQARCVTIRQEDPTQPGVLVVLQSGEANSARLYPAESKRREPFSVYKVNSLSVFMEKNL